MYGYTRFCASIFASLIALSRFLLSMVLSANNILFKALQQSKGILEFMLNYNSTLKTLTTLVHPFIHSPL